MMETTHSLRETLILDLDSKFSKNKNFWLINYLYTCIDKVFYLSLYLIKLEKGK